MLLFAEMRVEEVAQISFESVEILLEVFAERSVSHGKTLIKEWDFGIEKCPCFLQGDQAGETRTPQGFRRRL